MPEAAEVREALERVLASRTFGQAGRAKEFLKFVVAETLAGRGDRLKGYTIAVEVFDRSTDFDAQSDPLVRVEAGRLRRRLIEYYAGDGAADPVRIKMPPGGYEPEFAYAQQAPIPTLRAALGDEPRLRLYVVGALLVLAAAAAAWLLTQKPAQPLVTEQTPAAGSADAPALDLPRNPKVLVVPFVNLNDDSEVDYFAYGVTEEMVLSLMRFDVLVVIAAHDVGQSAAPDDLPSLPPDTEVAYILTGTVRKDLDRIRITARLVAAPTQLQLWSEAFNESVGVATLLSIQERIAARVATTVAGPFGPIFEQEVARATRKPAEDFDTYDCILQFRYYRRTLALKDHARTAACFESAVEREPGVADAWAGVALLYLDEHLYGYNPKADGPDALTRAHEAARAALDIDGASHLAMLAITRVRFHLGDLEGFERAAERLLAASPNFPDDVWTIAALRGIGGDWERALPLIEDMMVITGGERPGLFSAPLALYEMQTGDYAQALAYALEMDVPDWHMSEVIVAACAGLAGRDDLAERALTRLRALNPGFEGGIRAQLEKWHPNAELLARLIEGLNAAGLEVR